MMSKRILIGLVLVALGACQTSPPIKVPDRERQFLKDSARINAFVDRHPWSAEEVSGDIGDAVAKIEYLEHMGPGYLQQRDDEYTKQMHVDQQKRTAVQNSEQKRVAQYEQRVARSVHKRPMGSFGEAYYRLYAANQFTGRSMKAPIMQSGMLDGIFNLDLAFRVRRCNENACFAVSETGIGKNSERITVSFIRPVPLLAGDVVRPSYIEILGEDAQGILVAKVLAPTLNYVR
ncbi:MULTISPECIES: hypothetical protein [Pseudomonas syringae group]|nr:MULTISPECIES: hypothetical protein [Pseudomonas syringae group]KPY20008.1 hypothetical protein ALO54_200117 [Pseudomonas syringae pv. philadelphi]